MISKQYLDKNFFYFFYIGYIALASMLYRHTLHVSAELGNIDNSLKTVDLIIFSYDRPMQLYALLESIDKNLTGIESTTVIYRSSNDRFAHTYKHIEQQYSHVNFIKQGTMPTHDFKHLVLQAFRAGTSAYICFAVDDIIIKSHADLSQATQALESTGSYGFFLRLGSHLTACYSTNKPQQVPPMTPIPHGIYQWTFNEGTYDWNFAHTVDMTIYKKTAIVQDFIMMKYSNPNKLEGAWSHYAKQHHNEKGLCYNQSVAVNIPTNLVQDVCDNRHMHSWTPEQLLEKFNEGQKIDISALQNIKNESCHIAYALTFTAQNLYVLKQVF
jgi:hypothetical protein